MRFHNFWMFSSEAEYLIAPATLAAPCSLTGDEHSLMQSVICWNSWQEMHEYVNSLLWIIFCSVALCPSNEKEKRGNSAGYLEDKWSARTKPDSLPGFRFDERKCTRLPLRSHLMYTNRWNLYKAKRLKAQPPQSIRKAWDLFYDPHWTDGKWMVAREGQALFWAQLPRYFPNPCSASLAVASLILTRPLPPLIVQIGSCHRLDLKSRLSSLSTSLCCLMA